MLTIGWILVLLMSRMCAAFVTHAPFQMKDPFVNVVFSYVGQVFIGFYSGLANDGPTSQTGFMT